MSSEFGLSRFVRFPFASLSYICVGGPFPWSSVLARSRAHTCRFCIHLVGRELVLRVLLAVNRLTVYRRLYIWDRNANGNRTKRENPNVEDIYNRRNSKNSHKKQNNQNINNVKNVNQYQNINKARMSGIKKNHRNIKNLQISNISKISKLSRISQISKISNISEIL